MYGHLCLKRASGERLVTPVDNGAVCYGRLSSLTRGSSRISPALQQRPCRLHPLVIFDWRLRKEIATVGKQGMYARPASSGDYISESR